MRRRKTKKQLFRTFSLNKNRKQTRQFLFIPQPHTKQSIKYRIFSDYFFKRIKGHKCQGKKLDSNEIFFRFFGPNV